MQSSTNPKKEYEKFHWGCLPTRVIHPADKLLPENLIEIGLLLELRIKTLDGKKVSLEISSDDYNNNHVAYDADHKYQRIYLVLSAETKRDTRKLWIDSNPTYKLSEVAKEVGSKHGTGDYRNIQVQVLGYLRNTVYYTEKKGDGKSGYIHRMGEEGGVEPVLCLSKDGDLWYAGGSYTCPAPGITN